MGFLDKAKQAAEQAQKKLEETQAGFNKSQTERGQQSGGEGAAVQYDKHGRPIPPDAPPAAGAPMPAPAQPPGAQPPPAPPSMPPSPAGAPVPEPSPAAAGAAEPDSEPQQDEPLRDGVNQTPDPFRPIQ